MGPLPRGAEVGGVGRTLVGPGRHAEHHPDAHVPEGWVEQHLTMRWAMHPSPDDRRGRRVAAPPCERFSDDPAAVARQVAGTPDSLRRAQALGGVVGEIPASHHVARVGPRGARELRIQPQRSAPVGSPNAVDQANRRPCHVGTADIRGGGVRVRAARSPGLGSADRRTEQRDRDECDECGSAPVARHASNVGADQRFPNTLSWPGDRARLSRRCRYRAIPLRDHRARAVAQGEKLVWP